MPYALATLFFWLGYAAAESRTCTPAPYPGEAGYYWSQGCLRALEDRH